MKKLEYLTPDEVESAHQATLQILSEVGVKLTHPTARDLLTSHGASLAGNRVLFPPDLVMDCLGKCPPIVRLGGRRVKSPEDLSLYTAHCAGITFA